MLERRKEVFPATEGRADTLSVREPRGVGGGWGGF